MSQSHYRFIQVLGREQDPTRLQEKFLHLLLELQNVERGSLWVRRDGGYVCIMAAGEECERIQGVEVPTGRPSVVGWVMEHGRMTTAVCGKDARHFKELEAELEVKSKLLLAFPMILPSGEVYGVVELIETGSGGDKLNLDPDFLELLQNLVDIGSIALGNSLNYTAKLVENIRLKATIEEIRQSEMVLGHSQGFAQVMKKVGSFAATDYPVLITGESGTGKELVAREIHQLSPRASRPFLAQNCSAIPSNLLESELFGYKKGAFTGALKDKIGLFEAADGGTVFLDEIGDMPLDLQARILRVLEEMEVKPLGSQEVKRVNVRVVSATNVDLAEAIEERRFREDLFYRLNVLPLPIPPLRERREDIPILLNHFLKREAAKLGLPHKRFDPQTLAILREASWRGNVRELENFVKQVLVLTEGDVITPADLPSSITARTDCRTDCRTVADDPTRPDPEGPDRPDRPDAPGIPDVPDTQAATAQGKPLAAYKWDELERDYFLSLLERHKWNVSSAAREAGLIRSTFDSRMKKLGLSKH